MIALVVAVADNGTIGLNGSMPWPRIQEDMTRFYKLTKNHAVIMGRKTFESIGKPLPKRHNIILTRNPDFQAEGCHIFSDKKEALGFAKKTAQHQFVIGGAEIYKIFLNDADKIYMTRIRKDYPGDTFFRYMEDDPTRNSPLKIEGSGVRWAHSGSIPFWYDFDHDIGLNFLELERAL